MKIYTKTGDSGETGLFGGGRVPKDHGRVEAYGGVDELNSAIGVALTLVEAPTVHDELRAIQEDLLTIGAHLATPPAAEGRRSPAVPELREERVEALEGAMDRMERDLEPLRHFLLPGGSAGAASLHLCRTVCRRAERGVVRLTHSSEVEPGILRYLNRLSDYLFVAARAENARAGVAEPRWHPPETREREPGEEGEPEGNETGESAQEALERDGNEARGTDEEGGRQEG